MSADNNDDNNRDDRKEENEETITREQIALEYLDSLLYEPYPFQEQAILEWFESKQGALVCAPTGMGKTLIAEAGLYEALRTGKRAYYTTPLIALTEQKYRELQDSAERWGFDRSDVGLITGNRRENVDATVLVVVAEILFNRLLSSNAFDSFARQNESREPATDDASQEDNQKTDKPRISAASINAKRSVAVGPDDVPVRKEDEQPRAPSLPEIPIDESDFEEEDDELINAHFSFDDVAVVVMDEFHQFSDPERGVVWEFTLGLLPPHVRTLLISATVGNAVEFASWLRTTANRSLSIVQSDERKVPLVYQWVEDAFLEEHVVNMCKGTEEERTIPALVFRFNRDECWEDAEIIKGKGVVDGERQKLIAEELENYDLRYGAGPKLRQLFLRGIGVHHAGVLPRYRRIVEDLFQKKLLSFCVCTETLAAGVNLPARSVVLPTLLKGPAGDKKLVDPNTARQIFGRAGRPQFDSQGFVFALPHKDDVRIARARKAYDAIPEDVKDPKLREQKKKLKKKLPSRNPNEQYWTEKQFEMLQTAKAANLTSRGQLPWRLLAHMIEHNSDVRPIRTLVARRLMGAKRLEAMQRSLDQMLLTLWRGGFVRLAPNPERYGIPATAEAQAALAERRRDLKEKERKRRPFGAGIFDSSIVDDPSVQDAFNPESFENMQKELVDGQPDNFDFFSGPDLFTLGENGSDNFDARVKTVDGDGNQTEASREPGLDASILNSLTDEMRDQLATTYRALRAYPTKKIKRLTAFRGVNPVFGAFLLDQLGEADRAERIQAFECVLEMPATVARYVRPPQQDVLPPGALANASLDKTLLQAGLASYEELVMRTEEEETEEREKRRRFGGYAEERVYTIPFAEKLRRLFEYQYPGATTRITPVWAAGELLLDFHGDFYKYVSYKNLQKQEGILFRHLLRLILLLEEFAPLKPTAGSAAEWRLDLVEIGSQLVAACRNVDPSSVEETLKLSAKPDLLQKD
ncbi:MAG: DEAD/DEAH box helicase [Thermoguttaceae bacterium]|nr:DEAD/DEAH box helicase [Thermoguttaceae bacterium]